jgi:hypothetical protein
MIDARFPVIVDFGAVEPAPGTGDTITGFTLLTLAP